jgi:filamentous hemagglutinin
MAADLGDIPEAYIRDALGTTENGTRFSNIPEGLKSLGFSGTARYAENADVKMIVDASQKGAKAVVSVWEGGANSHAVVVDGISDGRAFIRDPHPVGSGSSYSISIEELAKSLTGRVVFIQPKP